MSKPLVVDADGHFLEPPDLWDRYLEPKFRDRAMRVSQDEKGLEYLEIDRRMSLATRGGTLGTLGGAYQDCADLSIPGKYTYWEVAQRTPGGIDPDARIREMDEQGIDIAILYGTIAIAGKRNAPIRNCPPPTAAPTTTTLSTFAQNIPTAWCRSRTSTCATSSLRSRR